MSWEGGNMLKIRNAAKADLESITQVEAECFPPAEAASGEVFARRLEAFPDHFWLLLDSDRLVGFVNGMVSDEHTITDVMYDNAEMHNESGRWQMIFGLDVIPCYRRQGCAGRLLQHVIRVSEEQGRSGVVLTCKEKLISYYEKFGFENEGISASVHGGAVWYDMRLTFCLRNTAMIDRK